jgi:RNA polymerase sigma-70 factor (ECF subfamily)
VSDERDRMLVRDFLEWRDEDDFRALYRRHTPRLYATAVRLTSDPARAADAVHDTWVRAVERLPSFAWRSTLPTWLTGILVHLVHEMQREDVRAALHEPVEDAIMEAAPALDPADAVAVRDAIARLPARARSVLVLHDVEGFTHEEIGEMLGVEPGTSKSQLSRARAMLRRALSEEEP